MNKEEISEEDEEFLQDIEELDEEKKNGVIAYLKNKCDDNWNEALQEMEKKIKSIRLSDFEDSLPQSLLLKDIEALKKEKQEGK